MKIQDFHKTNSYELTNHCVDTFKTHAISGNQQRWSWQPKIKSLEDLFHLLILLSLNNTFVWLQTCNITILLLNVNACCTICECVVILVWRHANPRTFPPYPWSGGVTRDPTGGLLRRTFLFPVLLGSQSKHPTGSRLCRLEAVPLEVTSVTTSVTGPLGTCVDDGGWSHLFPSAVTGSVPVLLAACANKFSAGAGMMIVALVA